MTKNSYFEMCEQLGTEPLESEIPVEFDDLVTEVQECLTIYNSLQDVWDYMGGNYIGKNFGYIDTVLELYQVPQDSQRFYFEVLQQIDRIRSKQIEQSKPKNKETRP